MSNFAPAAVEPMRNPARTTEPADLIALVQRAQGGEVEAFAGVLEQFERRVFHFVLRMLRNAHDAEDVTQDTFIKAWRHLASFRPRNSFSTWLFTIARRTALNHIRARRPTEELGEHDEVMHENPRDAAADREHAEAVWNLARRLKPDQYEVLWLCYGEGFSVNEIARIMNTNSLRVRVLLHRARKRLAEWLPAPALSSGDRR
jgi:RNA polymerase sigma-70 factor, ECF subfamily